MGILQAIFGNPQQQQQQPQSLAQNILASRFQQQPQANTVAQPQQMVTPDLLNAISQGMQPSMQDIGNTAINRFATKNPGLSAESAMQSRIAPQLETLSKLSEFNRSIAKINQGDLPQGYRINSITGNAELIPGVDPSFGKRADPFAGVMPVTLPNGQAGFAPKRDVNANPSAYAPPPTADNAPFKRENALRDEFNTLTKDFRTVQDAYSKIQSTSDNGAGDMSMLYSYVKLLDPGSVVRESEFATAAAAGSFGERVQGAVKGILSGGRLSPSLRKEFTDEAGRIYGGQKQGYDRLTTNYKDIAGRYGLDPKNIINDYAAPQGQGGQGGNISKDDAIAELRRRGKIK